MIKVQILWHRLILYFFFAFQTLNFFTHCKGENFSNACDPQSKAFYQTIFLKFALNDKSVTCGIGPVAGKEITSYSIPSLGITGIISDTNISLVSDTLSSFTPLVAKFTTTGESVSIGNVTQTSEVTSNSYSSNLVYTVTATDGTSKDYTVTLTAPRTYGGLSLVLWFKADSLILSDGANVQTWNDFSGRGNHLTQVTYPSRQPIYRLNQVNGLPALNFEQASLTSMSYSGGTGFSSINSGSFFLVFKMPQTHPATNLLLVGPANGREINIGASPGNELFLWRNGSGLTPPSVNSIPVTAFIAIASVQNTTVSWQEYWNGDLKGNATSNIESYVTGTVGSLSNGNMDGDIAEFFYFDSALSQNEIDKVFCYLRAKYKLIATTRSCGI
ncbi:MAG: hypothetical protein IBJ01_02420 [Leptospira sp.]|uniref:hypothetical protein n=1 Tax=Leptospira sp. TaxID=178 RepID=UPI0025BD30EC|nr:hypothetical protein [Leptospira sp.]MBL0953599.1 hypothetical protein [Leptospira sp.]